MAPLNPVEVRVLGALAEKALATPDYYPLSLNALVNACNQKTGREPVMELSDEEVASALDQLMRRRLAGSTTGAGSRVEKYRHLLDHAFELDRAGVAALTVLLLRGPQTAGEVRARTSRMHEFEGLDDVEATLTRLASGDPPLAVEMARQPGRKEPRFSHLLGGPVDEQLEEAPTAAVADAMLAARQQGDRVAELEDRLAALEEEFGRLQAAFDTFRNQFE
jgi:uncharacterized protein